MVKCYVDYNTQLADSAHADVFTANALVYVCAIKLMLKDTRWINWT